MLVTSKSSHTMRSARVASCTLPFVSQISRLYRLTDLNTNSPAFEQLQHTTRGRSIFIQTIREVFVVR